MRRPTRIYLIGSLRNPRVPGVASLLRNAGFDVFDDWYAAGSEADEKWREYEQARGHNLQQALDGYAANNTFQFDKSHLDSADAGVLVLPAGRSAHLELGYMAGKGKRTYILLDGEPERFDIMFRFATRVVYSVDELVKELKK